MSVGVQTEAVVAAQVGAVRAAGCEMVVGRQLHPAQAEAVERAERAAEQLERLCGQAEAAAARYRDAECTTGVGMAAVVATTATGGRQRTKAKLRRQAAAVGTDVATWAECRRQQRHAVQHMLEQRLDAAHERWSRQCAGEARVGEAEASRRFWRAAHASGISLCDAQE